MLVDAFPFVVKSMLLAYVDASGVELKRRGRKGIHKLAGSTRCRFIFSSSRATTVAIRRPGYITLGHRNTYLHIHRTKRCFFFFFCYSQEKVFLFLHVKKQTFARHGSVLPFTITSTSIPLTEASIHLFKEHRYFIFVA